MPEILKLVPRTNCGECGLPTCVAFAVQVVAGARPLAACPHVAPGDAELFADLPARVEAGLKGSPEEQAEREALRAALQARFGEVDFETVAERLGATIRDGRLAVHCLGRIFELDRGGRLVSQCHVNPWVHIPLLQYVLLGAPEPVKGEWVVIGEVSPDWARFFTHRCDRALRRTADQDPDLFLDVLDIFGARRVRADPAPGSPFADEAVVLWPLPRVPLLVSYWPPEDQFESKLTVFLDRSARANLGGEGLFQLGAGLGEMIRKIFLRFGVGEG